MRMGKAARGEPIAPVLDDLLKDVRLARLFSKDIRHCALQLWVLQVKFKQSVESRVVYGRLLPYSYSDSCWFAREDDDFKPIGDRLVQVVRLSLYIKSVECAALLQGLSAGRSLAEVSQDLNLLLSDQLKAKFGATALAASGLVYRPVAYLLNRDAYDQHSLSSPHGDASALSAAITPIDKGAMFRLGQEYDVALTASVIKRLNEDTGLDFGGIDSQRLGDLELLIFPTLDDSEKSLLRVGWSDAPLALVVRLNPMQLPHFTDFQFRLSIENGSHVVHSAIAIAEPDSDGVFECRFEMGEQLCAMTDSTELEVFGFHGAHSRQGTLCCRWRVGYMREIHLQSNVVGPESNPIKFDWLERTTRPSVSARVKAALTIDHSSLGVGGRIGGRDVDPWVPINREIAALSARLHPKKSEGRFFLRWGQGDGEGRLQFVEWFKALLAKYAHHQVVIFDPYFDAVGLDLMLLCADPTTDYVVFRSLPKLAKEGRPSRRRSDVSAQEGINTLLSNCEQSRHVLERIRLRFFGLKEGRLHDRYILIMGQDGLPVAGFSLSNSLQKAAENFPLLVTPIPMDVMLKVEQYKVDLIREAEATQLGSPGGNLSLRLLFDSKALPTPPKLYEPLRLLDKAQMGDVLSVWTGQLSLQGLGGDLLKDQMRVLGLLADDSLVLTEAVGLRKFLNRQAGDFTAFAATWGLLGEVLAHLRTDDHGFQGLESEHDFLKFLALYLESSFGRECAEVKREVTVMDADFFRKSIESLLYSSYHPHHWRYGTKYSGVTWSEYFAIKFLWWYAPDALLTIAETQMALVPSEPQGPDVMRLSLLSQITSNISQSVQSDISDEQRDRLVGSSSGLLQWLGFNAIEMQLEKPDGLTVVLKLVAAFAYPERIRILGWMLHHAAENPEKAEIYAGLIAGLADALPPVIAAQDLRRLVDSMRGHMRQLTWAGPWLFSDVVLPLLQKKRASTDDACEIWFEEWMALLGPKQSPRFFDLAREGQTTNIAACLFAHSSPGRRQSNLRSLQAILKRQGRIVKQPLASTSDEVRWSDALTVSMWILTFAQWGRYYLRAMEVTDSELDELSRSARELAMVRPMFDWRSEGTGEPGQLVNFLDQVDELLG